MKHSLRYGFYLGGALILSYVFYYFIDQASMFKIFSKATIWEILLYVGFMFFAISKNKKTLTDSGISFKIALMTIVIGITVSSIFRETFSFALAEELNPIYLESNKADEYYKVDLFGADPLQTLERAELMEGTIQEDFDFFDDVLMDGIFGLLIGGIPFSLLVSFLSRQVLRFRKD